MNSSRAANLSIASVAIGWGSIFFGGTSLLGDPTPTMSRATVEANRHLSVTIVVVGVIFLLFALWLSGHSFSGAKARATVVALFSVLPLAALFYYGLM